MSGCKLLSTMMAGAALVLCGGAGAMDDADLAQILDRRIQGDLSGACVAAALIQGERVTRAWRCADPADAGRIGPEVAFEIGSVTKTMAGILLADLIASGEASLDDTLAGHLPTGAAVPDFQGQPIRLRHLVTHTSGLPRLPSRLRITDAADPYAGLGADD
ncbi:MAG: serine hydrolase, partial [Lysobacterales bacterium]